MTPPKPPGPLHRGVLARTPRHSSDIIRERLTRLNMGAGKRKPLSWRSIEDEYFPTVPAGTLQAIAEGGKCPPKHKRALGLGGYRDWFSLTDAEIAAAKQEYRRLYGNKGTAKFGIGTGRRG